MKEVLDAGVDNIPVHFSASFVYTSGCIHLAWNVTRAAVNADLREEYLKSAAYMRANAMLACVLVHALQPVEMVAKHSTGASWN